MSGKTPVEMAKGFLTTSPRWCNFEEYLDGQIGYIEKAVAQSYVLDNTLGGFTNGSEGVPVYAHLSGKDSLVMAEVENLISEVYLVLNEIDKRKEFAEGYISFLRRLQLKLMKQELGDHKAIVKKAEQGCDEAEV